MQIHSLASIGNPTVEIRCSYDHFISILGYLILENSHFILKKDPSSRTIYHLLIWKLRITRQGKYLWPLQCHDMETIFPLLTNWEVSEKFTVLFYHTILPYKKLVTWCFDKFLVVNMENCWTNSHIAGDLSTVTPMWHHCDVSCAPKADGSTKNKRLLIW